MFSHAQPYHLVTHRHLPFLVLVSTRRCLSAAPSPAPSPDPSCPDPTDLWIAKLVSTVFRLSSSPAAAADRLVPLRGVLSPSVVLAALRRLPDPLSALGLFRISRSALGVVHFAAAFRFLICSLWRSDLHNDALKVFEEMVSDGHAVDDPFMEFLANSTIKAGKSEIAVGFLARASELGYNFQTYTFNKLLSLLVGASRINVAVLFLRQYIDSKLLAPDTCGFNIIIRGLCRLGDMDAAFEFLKLMKSFGCLPDTVTHNILIDGLCRTDQVDRGHQILQRIQLENSCIPNVVTFTSVISGFCRTGQMAEASRVFDEMIGVGIIPSRITYNVLIDGYGKVGNMQKAIHMYERMIVCGCAPDVVTFTSLIDGYCRSGQLDDAMKLWNEMNQRELQPNVYTFSIVIHSFCRKNRLSEARNFLTVMNGRRDIRPRAFMYNPVIDGLCKAGNVNEANVVLLEMEERGCAPDKYTYTILIIGHCMKGRMLEAIAIFQRMVTSGCTPDDITVSSLVSCLLKAGFPSEVNKIMLIASGRSSKFDKPCLQEIPSSIEKSMGITVAV